MTNNRFERKCKMGKGKAREETDRLTGNTEQEFRGKDEHEN